MFLRTHNKMYISNAFTFILNRIKMQLAFVSYDDSLEVKMIITKQEDLDFNIRTYCKIKTMKFVNKKVNYL